MQNGFRGIIFLSLILMNLSIIPLLAEPGLEENSTVKEGIAFFQKGKYLYAVDTFINILNKQTLKIEHGDAYFWLAKTYFVVDDLSSAEKNLEYFLLNFKTNPNYAEAVYLKGRMLFAQKDYENATLIFNDFIEKYPDSSFISHAYFWIGESLFLLGKLETAQKIFQSLINNYPQSVKIEAAQYRISLVDIKKRESELLKLLKMSHEELLKLQEESQKKLKTYEQAIEAYQKKLSSNNDNSLKQAYLEEQLRTKEKEVEELKLKIAELNDQLQKEIAKQKSSSSTTTTTIPSLTQKTDTTSPKTTETKTDVKPDTKESSTSSTITPDNKQLQLIEYKMRLLEAKEESLKLKDFLLEKARALGEGL